MGAIDFPALLKEAMGLDAASIGASAVNRAVRDRMHACRLTDQDAYWRHVTKSAPELQSLIETVVVPETWFFRDREAFAMLARSVRDGHLRPNSGNVVRILSVPCSTGEEPYSIAMALLDAGVSGSLFRVDAVDISTHSLAQASRACYGRNSFRRGDLSFRARYFETTPTGHVLKPVIRQQVHFRHGNLLERDLLLGLGPFDAIFCRNLLIYFERATQEQALNVLEQLLSPDGILFVAPSETGALLNHRFVVLQVPSAYAFQRGSPAPAPVTANPRLRVKAPVPLPPLLPPGQTSKAPPAATPHQLTGVLEIAKSELDARMQLEEAARLANEGHFVEAASCCEAHLKQFGPSAEAYHLLGVVRDASGNQAEASNYYRKALYLDPNHHEVLIHLALLMDRQDNRAEAQILRARARRVAESGGAR